MHLAPVVDLTAEPARYAEGMRGVAQTLGVMRRMVDEGKRSLAIRQAATNVVFLTPERDAHAAAAALFEFVRDHVRYIQDIHGVETLHTPEKTLAQRLGDCDDQTTLLAALLESVGYATRFVVAGYSCPGTVEHVYLQTLLDGEWVDLDPTEYGQLGEAPPDPLTVFVEAV